MPHTNTYPKLHNAAWPGVVGKGEGSEPPIDLDTMLDLTAAAEVEGVKFDGVDLFLFDPHVSIDSTRRRSEAAGRKGPAAQPGDRLGRGAGLAADGRRVGDGRATTERKQFLEQVRKGCRIAKQLRELGIRPYGVVRIDSATQRRPTGPPATRRPTAADRRHVPRGVRRSPRTSASGWPPRAKSAGAACTVGGAWCELLEMVGRPQTLGFQADMAHTLLYVLGHNAPEDAILPADFDWKDTAKLRRGAASN